MYPLELKDVIDPFIDEALNYAGDENDIKVYLKGMIAALPIIMQELRWHEGDPELMKAPDSTPGSSINIMCEDSSIIRCIEYWSKIKELFIQFRKTGKLYAYQNVPLDIFNGLVAADSRGKFFNQHIKTKFEFVDVTEKGEEECLSK